LSSAEEIFAHFAQERRALPLPGYRRDTPPGIVRYTPVEPDFDGLIVFADLPAAEVEPTIATQLAYFDERGLAWEWKVYDLDRPPDLASHLARHGFVAEEREAFMIYALAGHRSRPLRPGIRLERVTSAAGIKTIVDVLERVWGERSPWLERSLADGLAESLVLLAYAGEKPVGTGWVKFVRGSVYADLHGGAVLPDYRGHGIYSALFDERAGEAQRRGFSHLTVDARSMSRPILLRQGFRLVCETTPFRMPAKSTRADASSLR
jgi:GNAT superfamily N-acetyltransferase